MRGRDFYLAIAVGFAIGLVSTAISPEATIMVLAGLVPAVIVAALVSTVYLFHVYRAQPIPRSRFFGMLIETFVALLALGIWVGYVSVGRILDGPEFGWSIPVPPTSVSSPMSALIVILVFGAPVRFALDVLIVRRRSSKPHSRADAAELDRRDPE